ncbi:MAG: ligase-associated DNA damage response exonuclease [Myxococcota bacterium]
MDLITSTEAGLYCAAGDFHIDPWMPVPRAVITHAHADHARPGCGEYLCAAPSVPLLVRRLGPEARVTGWPYGHVETLGSARVSLHPAGHILGSAQVRVELGGEVWVASGDYKQAPDATCTPFEPVRCDVFITEATFALPIYQWDPPEAVFQQIHAWWSANAAEGRASILFCYALGKAQRILHGLMAHTDKPVLVHGAVEGITQVYREAGVPMLPTVPVVEVARGTSHAGQLILAPISAAGTPWMKRFGDHRRALASGFMRVRGNRRRRAVDRGFVLSDHADWPALLDTIRATGARKVLTTHGYTHTLVRWLNESGVEAAPLATQFEGEADT